MNIENNGKMSRGIRFFVIKSITLFFQLCRCTFYYFLSDLPITGKRTNKYPILSKGKGSVIIGNAHIGINPSPYFYNSYFHIEARDKYASVSIGNDVFISNDCSIICDKTNITISDNVLIGARCNIVDSDFHNISGNDRLNAEYKCSPVLVSKNVFIGSNVTILKGVSIGENCVVASGSVVTKSFDPNLIIGGVPAKVIGEVSVE